VVVDARTLDADIFPQIPKIQAVVAMGLRGSLGRSQDRFPIVLPHVAVSLLHWLDILSEKKPLDRQFFNAYLFTCQLAGR